MDCVKRKNQNQKFRQISHFPFYGSRLDNSARRHAATIGLMPIEPFFTIQDFPLHRLPTTPIANDLTNTPIANDLTTRDHPFHDSRSRDAPIDAARWRLEKKKRFRERVGRPSSVRSNTRDASRVFKRTRRSMRRVAHSSIAFNLVRVGWTDVPA